MVVFIEPPKKSRRLVPVCSTLSQRFVKTSSMMRAKSLLRLARRRLLPLGGDRHWGLVSWSGMFRSHSFTDIVLVTLERTFYYRGELSGSRPMCGCTEAGNGCWANAVFRKAGSGDNSLSIGAARRSERCLGERSARLISCEYMNTCLYSLPSPGNYSHFTT